MSVEQTQGGDPFASLYPYEFMVITTYRKSGVAVPTTVWFTHDNGKLYVTTTTTAGKIKRIRNNGKVFVAPSDRIGNVLGDKVEGYAHEVTPTEHEYVIKLLSTKYGAQFDAIINSVRSQSSTRTYIEVSPVQ